MKIEKKLFLDAMKKCLPGVEKGTAIIDGADTFVFSKKAIHSYNDNISVSVPFITEKEIDGAVKSIDLFNLISKISSDEIEIEEREESFKITDGKTKIEMIKIKDSISEYISTLNISKLEWKSLPDNFLEAIRLCRINNNSAPQRGIFVDDKKMMSTDIVRINYFELSSKIDRFWLDDPSVSELVKIEGLEEYSVSESWTHFKSKNGTIFSCKRKDDSRYPEQKIEEIVKSRIAEIHKKEKDEGDVEGSFPKEISNVVDRVSVLSSEVEGSSAIRMTIRKDELEFFAKKYAGKINEKIKLDQPLKKDVEIKIWVDSSFLIEAAKKGCDFYIKSTDSNIDNLTFHSKDYMQIVSTIIGDEDV